MAKGSRGGSRSPGRERSGGLNPADIKSMTSLVSAREGNQKVVDDVLKVARDIRNEFGGVLDGEFMVAEIGGRSTTLGFYDGANVALNKKMFESDSNGNYDYSASIGHNVPRGNNTAVQAVIAHELGHMIHDQLSVKMGEKQFLGMDRTATKIVKEAMSDLRAKGQLRDRGIVQFERRISSCAASSNSEAIAEAFADVYSNRGKAKRESHAIVNVVKRYLGV